MNADIERLISLLKEPNWHFDQIDLYSSNCLAPEHARLAIESVQRRAAVVEIQFFAPELPGHRRRMTIEAPGGVGLASDSVRWQVESAREVTWEQEVVPPSATAPAVVIGRKRAR